jgi:hypothetical protein
MNLHVNEPGETPVGLPVEGTDKLHIGQRLRCIDDFGAEPWLKEDGIYTFLRWANGNSRLQIVEVPMQNFNSNRFVTVHEVVK